MNDTVPAIKSTRENPGEKKPASKTGDRWVCLALLLGTATLYCVGFRTSLGEFTDAPHHLANGVFVYDALHHPITALSNPKAYILNYYRYYPAVNLGYYPPFFALLAGLLMFVFGVSGSTAQLAVALCAVSLTFFCYRWMRIHYDIFWSAAACLLVSAIPFVVYWGRDIMLDIPVLAFVTGSVWAFERLLRTERPTWRQSLTWALLTTMALWTKQNALLLLPVFLIGAIAHHKLNLLKNRPVWVSTVVVIGATGCLLGLMFYVGGAALAQSVGVKLEHVEARFNVVQWVYYLKRLPIVAGWPLLVTATLGLVTAIVKRGLQVSVPLAWLGSFYVLHSYTRAQDVRYATLCVPPLAFLAILGLQKLPSFFARRPMGIPVKAGRMASGLLVAFLVAESLYGAVRVRVPVVSTNYLRAMAMVRDNLGQYTCLSFVPVHPSRPASLYRIINEKERRQGRDILSFGRILRAGQVLRDRPKDVAGHERLLQDLRRWNVTMILIERPLQAYAPADSKPVAKLMETILESGEFQLIKQYNLGVPGPRYPIVLTRKPVLPATLSLYKRREPIPFNPHAAPPIHPRRVRFDAQPTLKPLETDSGS